MGEKLRAARECLPHPLPLCRHWRCQSPPPLPEEGWESQLWLDARPYELDYKITLAYTMNNNSLTLPHGTAQPLQLNALCVCDVILTVSSFAFL